MVSAVPPDYRATSLLRLVLLFISYIKMNSYIIYTQIQYILFAWGHQNETAVRLTSTVT